MDLPPIPGPGPGPPAPGLRLPAPATPNAYSSIVGGSEDMGEGGEWVDGTGWDGREREAIGGIGGIGGDGK